MDGTNSTKSPLDAVDGTASPHATDVFRLLSNETRLAILVALWEAYDPRGTNHAVSFSDIYERVGARDSGNFSYHLDKLTGHFVYETDDGYELRNAGHKIVRSIIAGAGLEEQTLQPTVIERSCHRCGAAVEISYADGRLYHTCTECEGNIGPDSTEGAPSGTLVAWDFAPAGLSHRTPGEVYVAGTIAFLRDLGLLARGVCRECSGPVAGSLHICEHHDPAPGELCSACGTRDKVRVSYDCTVCKHGASFPVQAAVHDHPATVAFYYEHGMERTYDLDHPGECGRLWERLLRQEHTLVSEDPVRVRVTIPCEGDVLHLTLDDDLTVVDVTEDLREAER